MLDSSDLQRAAADATAAIERGGGEPAYVFTQRGASAQAAREVAGQRAIRAIRALSGDFSPVRHHETVPAPPALLRALTASWMSGAVHALHLPDAESARVFATDELAAAAAELDDFSERHGNDATMRAVGFDSEAVAEASMSAGLQLVSVHSDVARDAGGTVALAAALAATWMEGLVCWRAAGFGFRPDA